MKWDNNFLYFTYDNHEAQRGEVNCPEITLKGKDHQTPKLRQWVVHFSQVFETLYSWAS